MSDRDKNNIRNPDDLTVSEIDRLATYESDSDLFSSDDSYRPSHIESSDEGELSDNEDTLIDNASPGPSGDATISPAATTPGSGDSSPIPGTSVAINNLTPPPALQPTRGRNAPRPTLPWNNLPQLKTFLFREIVGLKVPTPGEKPIDWFSLIIDDDFLEGIVRESNRYAEEIFLSANTKDNSRICQWKDLTLREFKTFLGLLFHTGIVRMPTLQDYWKTDQLFHTCFGEYMSRDRFLIILRCLHLVHDDETDKDRLRKIKPAVEYFNNKMHSIYTPSKELSLDESMVLYRGRLIFKQYIKNKRHKYGVKLYMLTEPNGLTMKFTVYAGAMDILSGQGHTEKVVFHLMQEWLGKGYSIYADNFYNSISLTKALSEQKTYITGTLRADRKDVSAEVVKAKLKKGETIAKYHDGIMVGKWRDVRDVVYISSQYENSMELAVNKRGQEKVKPMPIREYNTYMSGIDRKDQLMSYYPCERKTVRWYKKLIIHILQMGIVNAYILFNKTVVGNKMTLLEFRLAVIRSLLAPEENRNGQGNVRQRQEERQHVPTKVPLNDKGIRGRRRCKQCSREGKRKDTTYQCKACPGEPALCLQDCFENYHA